MIGSSRTALALGIATVVIFGSASVAHAQYQAPPPPAYQAPPPPGYYQAPPPPGYYQAPPPRYAYPPPPPPRRYGMYRQGLVVGFALGGGDISGNCNAAAGFCGTALSLEGHIGGMLNPRSALMLDIFTNVRDVDNSSNAFSQTFYTAAMQFWLLDQLWLKGGLGISHVSVTDAYGVYTSDDTALGLVLGAGVEVLQVANMALDLQFRAGFGFYNPTLDNYAFLVGLSWY